MSNMLGRIAATNPTMTAGIPGELNIRAISLWHDGAIYCQDQNAMSKFSRQTNSIRKGYVYTNVGRVALIF